MGQCLACSQSPPSLEEYNTIIHDITSFLQGGYKEIKKILLDKMYQASEQLNFERAKEYRDQIRHIEVVMEQQKIILNEKIDLDIFGYSYEKGWMCVQVFFVRQGKLIERDVSLFPFLEEAEETFISFIGRFYLQKKSPKTESNFITTRYRDGYVRKITRCQSLYAIQGKKKRKLVEMAMKNASISLQEKFSLIERNEERTIVAVEKLGEIMNIETPSRIEAFDNSNIQGVDPVSAMVVFIDGKPAKKEYRKYKIKTVQGPDDYATMREVVRRRYSRVLQENLPLPDLIVVDGGKGQMSAARDVLENELGLDIPLCGLAKDEYHRTSELLYGDPPEVMPLSRKSQEFYLVQRIQDEVHRFAITFHRQQRGKRSFQSELDNIPGIGEKRKRTLIKYFKSLERIKTAEVEEIIKLGIPKKNC